MPIDTAEKRKAAGGVPFLPLCPGVTPSSGHGAGWRKQVAWSYAYGGAGPVIDSFGGWIDAIQLYVPGAVGIQTYVPGAVAMQTYLQGAVAEEEKDSQP